MNSIIFKHGVLKGPLLSVFLDHPRQEPLVFILVILQQIDPPIIGPDLKIEIVFSIPAIQDFLYGKDPFKELKGKGTFRIAVTGITGDLNTKPLISHLIVPCTLLPVLWLFYFNTIYHFEVK